VGIASPFVPRRFCNIPRATLVPALNPCGISLESLPSGGETSGGAGVSSATPERWTACVSRAFRCRGVFHERSLTPTLPLIITLMHNAASLLFTPGPPSRGPHDLRSYCSDVAGAAQTASPAQTVFADLLGLSLLREF